MDNLVIFSITFLVGLLGLFAFLLFKIRNSSEVEESDEIDESQNEPERVLSPNEMRLGSKIIKNRNAKSSAKKVVMPRQVEEDEEDLNEEDQNDQIPSSSSAIEGKIGKKKLLKLEMKAEKKAARERELQLREEKRIQKEKEDEIQRQLEEEREAKEKEKEEEEKRLLEEQKKKEYELYLQAKKAFQVEEEGFDANVESDQQNKLVDFINYVKEKKIVMLEELASEFKLKTQDVITRIQDLLESEQIEGVIDDRGKFIYITDEEFNLVSKFIKQRGRVSITELVENSNRLIQLQTKV